MMSKMKLENGSRVAVIGGGPAGSFFSYFLLDMAQRASKEIAVDIFEPRDFDKPGPAGCNNCGGIISEWLVQALAADGINLPTNVVERGIDSYVMRMDVGDALIETPLREKRIGAVHRGAGPRGIKEIRFRGFDSFLIEQAENKGARVVRGRVDGVERRDGRPFVKTQGGEFQAYDLLAVAMGKNNPALKMFEKLDFGYAPPKVTKTYIAEIYLGAETVAQYLGTSMHVFLLDMPRLEFAAIIPKGDYATMCLLGEEIDRDMVNAFVNSDQVKHCMPPNWTMPADLCHCSPVISIGGAAHPFADRIVFVGDCGVTRLYKDGIGASYRTAKAAATTAIFEGVAAADFQKQYAPLLKSIALDNAFGRVVFMVTRVIQRMPILRRGVLRMIAHEQCKSNGTRWMSAVLWDTFTGSAPYREVFMRTLHPGFWSRFIYDIIAGVFSFKRERVVTTSAATHLDLGKIYRDGETFVRQGESGDTMFVIQAGQVEVVQENDGKVVPLAVRGEGEFFGEMALVERETRSASVRALGEARVLTIDQRTFHRRVREDPALAYRILQKMSQRIRATSSAVTQAHVGSPNPRDAAQIPTTIARNGNAEQVYRAGEILMREGDTGDTMFVIQWGQVAVTQQRDGKQIQLATRRAGDFVGEMALFERETRSATLRAVSDVRVLVMDRETFMRQVHENPALAYRMMQKMSSRIREASAQLAEIKGHTLD